MLGLVRAIWEWQRVEVRNERPCLRRNYVGVRLVGDTGYIERLPAGVQSVDKLDQRLLPFVTHDAVDLWKVLKQLLITQAGIVAADGEVALDASSTQLPRHLTELRQKELENERESDHQRLARRELPSDRLAAEPHVDHLHRAAMSVQHGRQVAHAEIALILIADQCDVWTARSGKGGFAGTCQSLAPPLAIAGI